MSSSPLFCPVCGAANNIQATHCFACNHDLSDVQSAISVTSPLLKQRYRTIATLGQGGMGAVYKAEDTELGNRLVAIKEMSQKGLNQQEANDAVDGFKREALLLAGLMQPNLPRITTAGVVPPLSGSDSPRMRRRTAPSWPPGSPLGTRSGTAIGSRVSPWRSSMSESARHSLVANSLVSSQTGQMGPSTSPRDRLCSDLP